MRILKFLFVSLLFVFSSCEKDQENLEEEPIEETELKFEKTTLSVTFELCDLPYCSVRQLSFITENIGYAVTGVNLYKTENGGEDWSIVTNNDITGRLIVLPEDLMFLNTYDAILKTTNGGDSWTPIERPLEFICSETGSINTGSIHFADATNGFIQDNCYKGQLYKTNDVGDSWELIYDSDDEILEYYFVDSENGFVIVNDIIYLTKNGGSDWEQIEILPSSFDYVIEREDSFLFPEGKPSVDKPEIVDENVSITKFDVNDNGNIAIVLYDESTDSGNWSLMLYVNNEDEPKWISVDQLPDLDDNAFYSSIQLTNEKTMYIAKYASGEIFKYYVE